MKILWQSVQQQLIARIVLIYVLAVIMIAGMQLTSLLQEILRGELLADALLAGLFLAIIDQSGLLLAISYFLALFFLLTQLYEYHEMDIIFTLGVGEKNIFIWLLPSMIFFVVVVGLLVFYLAPLSVAQLDYIYGTQIVRKIEGLADQETQFLAGIALQVQESHVRLLRVVGDLVEMVEGSLLRQPQLGQSEIVLSLQDGHILRWEEQHLTESYFTTGQFHIPYSLDIASSAAAIPWFGGELGEFYQRLAIVVSIPVALPLALVCARRRLRRGAFLNSFLSIIVYFLYLILVIASIGLVRSDGNILVFWLIQTVIFVLLMTILWGWHLKPAGRS